jgi:hypothetical protein
MTDIFPEIPNRLFVPIILSRALPTYPSTPSDPVVQSDLPEHDTLYMNASLASRGDILESLQMKNQWRDNMLKKAPLQTFGGKVTSRNLQTLI